MKPMEPMKPMQPMKPLEPMRPPEAWWPKDLGEPSSSGSQNDRRYAYFDSSHRLAVDDGRQVTVYDTGRHRIGGFAQQQGATGSMQFSSDEGVVDLKDLSVAD